MKFLALLSLQLTLLTSVLAISHRSGSVHRNLANQLAQKATNSMRFQEGGLPLRPSSFKAKTIDGVTHYYPSEVTLAKRASASMLPGKIQEPLSPLNPNPFQNISMVNMTRTPLNRTEKLQNITNTQRTTTIVSALIYVNAALAEIDIAKASGFTVINAGNFGLARDTATQAYQAAYIHCVAAAAERATLALQKKILQLPAQAINIFNFGNVTATAIAARAAQGLDPDCMVFAAPYRSALSVASIQTIVDAAQVNYQAVLTGTTQGFDTMGKPAV